MIQYFKFEQDFVEDNIRCIPMIARFKLDACGIKLSLKEWSVLTDEEKVNIAEYPCNTENDIQTYRKYIKALILFRTRNKAQELEVEICPGWADTKAIPDILLQKLSELDIHMEILQWHGLNELQRFVLVKLSRPGHENRNFPIAMKEFGLL